MAAAPAPPHVPLCRRIEIKKQGVRPLLRFARLGLFQWHLPSELQNHFLIYHLTATAQYYSSVVVAFLSIRPARCEAPRSSQKGGRGNNLQLRIEIKAAWWGESLPTSKHSS